MVAVFGIAGGFVQVFAGDAVDGIANEAGRGRVATGYAVLAGGGAFFGIATLDVGVTFFGAGATGAGRGQQHAGHGQWTEKLLEKHEKRRTELEGDAGGMMQGREITRRRATRTLASGCARYLRALAQCLLSSLLVNLFMPNASLPTPAYTYPEFRALLGRLAAEHRTTGLDQTPGLVRYTDQNQAHLDRSLALPLLPTLLARLRQLPRPEQWLVLGEAWCGDTAHTLPILAHLVAQSQDRVSLHVVLRSDHPELMAAYQTNGKNSIPKLIRRDAETGADLGIWGPRPAAAQALSHQLHGDETLHTNQIVEGMNEWYAADAGQSMQHELLATLG